jgi:CRP-like cAMP-binding protein
VAHPAQPTPTPHNRLLAALPPDDLARLWPRLEPIDLATRQVVHASGEPIAFVLFPETGWCSSLVSLEDGDSGEVGLIGCEELVGLPLLYGNDRSSVENIVQGPGTAGRLGAGAFRATLDESPALRALLLRYALAFQAQIAQTAACNGRHQVEQRLARWLLMVHDRAEGDTFPMTYEFLSMMLGIRRASRSRASSR